MIAQYRPDIARVAEETVVNLKGLENSIDALRNDVAWLCQTIGHPEAARVALTPSRVAMGAQFGIPSNVAFAPGALYGQIASTMPWVGSNPAAAGIPGFGANFPALGMNPYAASAFGTNFANTFAGNPLASAYANALLAAQSLQPGVTVPIVPAYR